MRKKKDFLWVKSENPDPNIILCSGVLTRILSFPILGIIPTLRVPAVQYGIEAGGELAGPGGIMDLALPNSGPVGFRL